MFNIIKLIILLTTCIRIYAPNPTVAPSRSPTINTTYAVVPCSGLSTVIVPTGILQLSSFDFGGCTT
jgi:hypothetical protein